MNLPLRVPGTRKAIQSSSGLRTVHRLQEARLELLPCGRTVHVGSVLPRQKDLRAVDRALEAECVEAAGVDLFRRSLTDDDLEHGALSHVVVECFSKIGVRSERRRGRIDNRSIVRKRANVVKQLERLAERTLGHAINIAVALLEKLCDAVADA